MGQQFMVRGGVNSLCYGEGVDQQFMVCGGQQFKVGRGDKGQVNSSWSGGGGGG